MWLAGEGFAPEFQGVCLEGLVGRLRGFGDGSAAEAWEGDSASGADG